MIQPDPGSFRDPDSRVFRAPDGRILRGLSAAAAERESRQRRSGLIPALEREGLLIETTPAPDAPPDGWAALREVRAIPFPAYPYEWSFRMLQDAGLLTLRLARRLLEQGGILRDASAYNVMFDGARPVFIDTGSLGDYEEGAPWTAYGQFCDHFLAPLMLEAFRGIPFQPLLRSSLDGIPIVDHLARLLGPRDLLRPGVLLHVWLRTRLEGRSRFLDTRERQAARSVRVSRQRLLGILDSLETTVSRLRSSAPSSWVDYETSHTYPRGALEARDHFVRTACAEVESPHLAWDVGANTGRFAAILAERFRTVVAVDADARSVDEHYRRLVAARSTGVLPLVMDAANPSPDQGWGGHERAALARRGRPDLAIYMAVLHHLCLSRGVPLPLALQEITARSPRVVIEFVAAEDEQSQRLLATRERVPADYGVSLVREMLMARGRIVAETAVTPTRTLFYAELRAA